VLITFCISSTLHASRPSPLLLDLVLQLFFALLYLIGIGAGSVLGSSFSDSMKDRGEGMKQLGLMLGICIPVTVVSLVFGPFMCSRDDVC
jgi:hypothetical protein